ncbi:hypothetical protein RclHR1_04530013 [Rhizophagus clarus]|uniref:Kinase-like domain-containing protein n=1 Tax=Rhizophagus clarus TaxID=94130 RepID=A0A2Z6RJJ6_9GLOM|nr:hypothetical protein RclHR1_04530013 [Rhizophagus clarus]GET02808.1 kinase-like domain-containing protein [Rhizophagus clarus]
MSDQNSTVDIEMRLRRYGRCYDCKQPLTTGMGFWWRSWCTCYNKHLQEDFNRWTSGNEIIDKFIQKKQLDASKCDEVIEWIPFDRLKDVEPLISDEQPEPTLIATWIDGSIVKWKNFKWFRFRNPGCFLKKLYLSDSPNENEIENQFKLPDIRIYGITKDPKESDYMLVIDNGNLCKKCLQLKARTDLEHWEAWCYPCNSKYFQGEFKSWTSGNGIIDKFIQKTQIEALRYYEVVEWIPFDRFNDIQVFKGESGSILIATWIDGPIRNCDYKNNKWERILANEKFCLRSIGENISDLSEIENQYKIRNTERNFISNIAILGVTKNPENNDYMIVIRHQNICKRCLWPNTGENWCNTCNARLSKNWTSGNEIIDKFIQKKQDIALSDSDFIFWIPFDSFEDIELIEGEFGTALKAYVHGKVIDEDGEGTKTFRLYVCLKRFNSSNISNEFLQEIINQEKLTSFREDRKDLIKVYGITKDPEKDDYMIVVEYSKKNICYKCLLPNSDDYWCNRCNSKFFRDKFDDWTSGNELINKFIKKKQLEALNHKEIILWIPFDEFQNIEEAGKGGFGTAFKAVWVHKENKLLSEVCLKRINNSYTITQEFLHEVDSQLNAQRHGNIIQVYGITKDPRHDDYMIVMNYAKEGSLRKMLDKHHSELSWRNRLQLLNFIAYALAGIHEANLLHKDLHSGNIVMTDIINSWITDFGLCKPISANRAEKAVYGVLPYVAPEVLRGEEYTEASDMYSFGIIMSEVLTGYPPYYDVAHDYSLAILICKGLKPINPEIRRGVPQLLLDLMDICLQTDPLERQTAGQVQNSIYYYLINCHDKSTEIGKQIDAIENSNISYPKFDSNTYIKHPLTCYKSRLLDYKDKLYTGNKHTEILEDSECLEYSIPDHFL